MDYYIYLFESVPGGIYKIGYALDPEKRMKKLERRGALGAARCRFGLSWTDEVEPWQSEACKPYYLLWSAPHTTIRRRSVLCTDTSPAMRVVHPRRRRHCLHPLH